MANPIPETPLLNEERWQAWVEKGKLEDREWVRKQRRWGAVVLPGALAAVLFYLTR